MTVVLEPAEGRNRLRIERRLAHPVERVWRAVTEPEHLNAWYPGKVTELELFVGGRMSSDYGDGMVTSGTVTEFDPPRVLAFTEESVPEMPHEGDNLVRIELRPDGDGCVLVFEHVFDDLPMAAGYTAGWHGCLDALAASLADEEPDADPPFVEWFEHYVRELGLDRPTVENGTVRVTRQLMAQPVEKVWRVLAPDGSPALTALVPAGLDAATAAATVRDVRPAEHVTVELPADGRIEWSLTAEHPGARLLIRHDAPVGHSSDPATTAAAWRDHVAEVVRRIIAADG